MLFVQGCSGGGGGGDSVASAISDDPNNTPPASGDPDDPGGPVSTIGVGELGTLVDLGDLLAPAGDHWYFTRAAGINDAGTVIGQSLTRSAFKWEPATGAMTALEVHSGSYDDFFNIGFEAEEPRKSLIYSEAVDINGSGVIIGNLTTGLGWPQDLEKRAFIWKDGVFTDLAPPSFLVPGPTFTDGEADEDTITFYRVTNKYSEAVDINEKGEVVLTMDDADGRHAYYWNGVDFDPVDLGYFDDNGPTGPVSIMAPRVSLMARIVGEDSEAVAINENGQAVMNSGRTAVFYDLNWQVAESLNHLPGATFTAAVDINDSVYTNNDGIVDGHIIGNSGSAFDPADLEAAVLGGNVQGFFWDGGAMYPVDHLGGGTSVATDINNSDQVVGGATTADGSVHAFLWTLDENEKGIIRDLGTLGGANSFATAINEAGQVTGWAETGVFYEEEGVVLPIRHAFLWDDGVMYDLGTHNDFYDYAFVPSYPFSEGVGINATAEVAGNSITINEHYRGFFLSPEFP
jgi:probable HAF family extracellular repeat protein